MTFTPTLPSGCKCNPDDYFKQPLPICDKFENNYGGGNCSVCEHELQCHKKVSVLDCGTPHSAFVTWTSGSPVVELSNNEDTHYVQYFHTRKELEAFVSLLIAACDVAWPIPKSK